MTCWTTRPSPSSASRYVEFAGQGHGLKGLDNQARVWAGVSGFLADVAHE